MCHHCGECLLEQSKSVFYCKTCSEDINSGDVLYFCLKCKKAEVHDHKVSKLKVVPGEAKLSEGGIQKKNQEDMNDEEKKQYLEGILDQYYDLDYEDLIGGGQIKARFKYRKVAKEDYGLTEDEILLLDDK